MSRPLLLDLFCGAGGAAMGYYRAGFDVVGVDIKPQPHYPFKFVQMDAIEYGEGVIDGRADPHIAAIHASPPCQFYASLAKDKDKLWRSIPPVRRLLRETGLPYVIENIRDATWDMVAPVQLCGSNFGLGVRRHRMFESNIALWGIPCTKQSEIRAYYGKKGWLVWTSAAANVQKKGRKQLLRGSVERAPQDMGIDWMPLWDELREAIPPAYTEFIGTQLLEHIRRSRHSLDGLERTV